MFQNRLLYLLFGLGLWLAIAGAVTGQTCTFDVDCDDGLFCNGAETCDFGVCQEAEAPACSPGFFCDESTDTCVSRQEHRDFWEMQWGPPVTDETHIEIRGFDPKTLNEHPSPLLEVRALDADVEVGQASLAPLAGTPVLLTSESVEQADGTPAEVYLHWLSGDLSLADGRRTLLEGLLVTVDLNGETGSVLNVFQNAPKLEDLEARSAVLRQSLQTPLSSQIPGQKGSLPGQAVPLVYQQPNLCFDEMNSGWPSLSDCGSDYCQCVTDATQGILGDTLCWAAIFPTVYGCFAAGEPTTIALCILAAVLTTNTCWDHLLDMYFQQEAIAACRRTADQCFCDGGSAGGYPQYCNDTNQVPIKVTANGLLPAEVIEIEVTCTAPDSSSQVREILKLDAYDNSDVVMCDPTWNGEVKLLTNSNDLPKGVLSPNVNPGDLRLCAPTFYHGNVDILWRGGLFFDCTCQNLNSCPTVFTYMDVEGLEEGERVDLSYNIALTNQNDNNTVYNYTLTGVMGSSNDTIRFTHDVGNGRVWNGSEIQWFLPNPVPNCELTTTGNIIQGTPNSQVKIGDLVCNEGPNCSNNESQCEVAFKGRVTGDLRPVDVQLTLDGQTITQTLDGSETLIANTLAGVSFSDVTVLNMTEIIDSDTRSNCLLASPRQGTVPNNTEHFGVTVRCAILDLSDFPGHLDDVDIDYTFPNECFLECPPLDGQGISSTEAVPCPRELWPVLCPDLVPGSTCWCDEITTSQEPCTFDCPGVFPVGITPPYGTITFGSGALTASGVPEVDDALGLQISASDPDGLQGSVVFVDGQLHSQHSAGGHSAADTGALQIDTSNLSEGFHELSVYTLDNHPDYPSPRIVTLPFEVKRAGDPCDGDVSGPIVSIQNPPEGATPAPGSLWIHATATDTLSSVDRVQFFVDGQMRHTDNHAPYGYTWHASAGEHVLKARAWDSCGNSRDTERTVTIQDLCLEQPPVEVSITNLSDGEWLDPHAYDVEVAISDPGNVGVSRMELTVGSFDPQVLEAAPWDFNGYWLLSEGPVGIEVRAFDACGRMDVEYIQVQISENADVCGVDVGPPWAQVTSPTAGAILPQGLVTVDGDGGDDTILYAAALEVNGDPTVLPPILHGNPAYWDFDWAAPVGNHQLRLRTMDVCYKVGFSPPVDVQVTGPHGESQAAPAPAPFAPKLHVLQGPVHPPGRPIVNNRMMDFGTFGAGTTPDAQPISWVNDGNGELVITDLQIAGNGFVIDPMPTLPLVVPPYLEGTVYVRPLTNMVGRFEATLEVTSNYESSLDLSLGSRIVAVQPTFADDFESGDLSAWDATSGGPVAATSASAIEGQYGLETPFQGNAHSHAYVREGLAPSAILSGQFALDTGALTVAAGEIFTFFSGNGPGGVPVYGTYRVENGEPQARAHARLDDGTVLASEWMDLGVGVAYLHFQWRAAYSAQADGLVSLSRLVNLGGGFSNSAAIDTVELTGLDNDQQLVDRFHLGAVWGIDSGTNGTLSFDSVSLW